VPRLADAIVVIDGPADPDCGVAVEVAALEQPQGAAERRRAGTIAVRSAFEVPGTIADFVALPCAALGQERGALKVLVHEYSLRFSPASEDRGEQNERAEPRCHAR
jgi:hypothetical protein